MKLKDVCFSRRARLTSILVLGNIVEQVKIFTMYVGSWYGYIVVLLHLSILSVIVWLIN